MAMRRMMVAVIAAIALVWSADPAMALTPVKVIGGPGEQYRPSSNGIYLAWASASGRELYHPARVPGKWNVYAKALPNGIPKKANASGTQGAAPSFVGSSNVLAYHQWSRTTPSDIYFYDASTGRRTKASPAVDRPLMWEFWPFASANYLLFDRFQLSRTGKLLNHWLLLLDRHSRVMRILASGLSKSFWGTFAGTTYVSWSVCGAAGCGVHYWSAAGGKHVQPSVQGREQFGATIDEATGQIYYTRKAGSGRSVTIRRSAIGSNNSTILASLPPGIDSGATLSLAPNRATGHMDLYFERFSWRLETGDIYALRGVDTV